MSSREKTGEVEGGGDWIDYKARQTRFIASHQLWDLPPQPPSKQWHAHFYDLPSVYTIC